MAAAASVTPAISAEQRPNILLIVADDLGYSDIGAFGGEIDTPNLDALAEAGARFAHFQVGATCSLTRSMLLSGVDNHLAGVGAMAEMMTPSQRGQPGYEGYLNKRVAAISEILHDGGYATYMTGKWHLGHADDQLPSARGFDRSFVLLDGGANHFLAKSIFQFKADAPIPAAYREDGKPVQWPDGQYSADVYATKMIDYLDLAGKSKDKPFFAYLAFTTPHWPLQAPAETIAKYKGRYDAGYDAIRAERLKRLKALGLVAEDATIARTYDELLPSWNSLTPDRKQYEARLMEIYAAMVDRMDDDIGRVIAALKKNGQFENTLIIFMSDNGAEGADPIQMGATKDLVAKSYDNSFSNLGSGTSYMGYGPRWAMVSASPFRMYKGFTFEGGLTSPMFFSGERLPANARGRIISAFAHVTDIVPTLLDFAGVAAPGTQFEGRDVYQIEGGSLKPALERVGAPAPSTARDVGAEFMGDTSLRSGNWKIVYSDTPWGTGQWELFDIVKDPGETRDLSASEPDVLERMKKKWMDYIQRHGVVYQRDELIQAGAAYRDGRSHYSEFPDSSARQAGQ